MQARHYIFSPYALPFLPFPTIFLCYCFDVLFNNMRHGQLRSDCPRCLMTLLDGTAVRIGVGDRCYRIFVNDEFCMVYYEVFSQETIDDPNEVFLRCCLFVTDSFSAADIFVALQ